jgi:toxin-antitoxin system, toxin component, hicA family
MAKKEILLDEILHNTNNQNIKFVKMVSLLERLGFQKRIRGDHHIFYMDGIEEIINIQPSGGYVKKYQVKQIKIVIQKYGLGGE